MRFNDNSGTSHNALFLNWHKILELLPPEEIKQYQPIMSGESYQSESVKFKRIEVTN
jgi:hypothetical protein